MVFSSETFLFLFLPIFLIAYYLTPNKYRNITLLIESYLFYGWWRFDFLMLLVGNTLWGYVFSLLVQKYQGTARAKLFVGIGVTGHLLVLGVFKYLNKYRFKVRSSHTFTSAEGKATRIEVVGFEKGGATTPLEKRPAIDFKVTHASGATE